MLKYLIQSLTGGVADKVIDYFKDKDVKEIKREQIKAELDKHFSEDFVKLIEAESKSESWLTKNWRPVTALAFAGVLFFYALPLPILVNWFGVPPLNPGNTLDSIIGLLAGFVGGYGALRSFVDKR